MSKTVVSKAVANKIIKSKTKYRTKDYIAYIFINLSSLFNLVFVILLNGSLILSGFYNKNYYIGIIGILFLSLVLGVMIFNFVRTRNLYIKKRKNPDIIYTFEDKKIIISFLSEVCDETVSIEYEKIKKILERPNKIYLVIDGNNFFVVDKYDMVEGSTNDMIMLLKSKVQNYKI